MGKRRKTTMPGVAGSPDDHLVKRTRLDIPHPDKESIQSQPKKGEYTPGN